jgi:hypothetical protein
MGLTYRLPDPSSVLSLHLLHLGFQAFPKNLLNVWNAFQLQLLSRFHRFKVMPSQQLQALAPSMEFPFGKYDMVLLYSSRHNGKLRVFMTCSHWLNEFLLRGAYGGAGPHCLSFSEMKKSPLSAPLKEPLLYVQFSRYLMVPMT